MKATPLILEQYDMYLTDPDSDLYDFDELSEYLRYIFRDEMPYGVLCGDSSTPEEWLVDKIFGCDKKSWEFRAFIEKEITDKGSSK